GLKGGDAGAFLRRMAGRADDKRLAMFGAERGHVGGDFVETELDDDIGAREQWFECVALIDLAGQLHLRQPRGAGRQRLAHASFRTVDDDLRHFRMPEARRVPRKVSRFFALMGTRGSRYSSSQSPSMARAAFTGIGLVSMNRSLARAKNFVC